MKVDMLNLQTLFYKPVRYEIPLFQRRYVWHQEEQWEPLWEDVRNTAEQIMEFGGHNASHFLGAVVLKQRLNQASMLEVREVVDGQQRLTTMQLLLDAVQEVFESHDASTESRQLSSLVLNDEIFHGGDLEKKFKVLPTLNDRRAFIQAMSNDLSNTEQDKSLIVQAHDYFKDVVAEWLNSHSAERQGSAIQALHTVVALRLEMVVIDLDPDEEEHVIFETLNARGTPLDDSDLIRNMMLAEASKLGINEQSISWAFDDNWWTVQIRQGRLYRSRSDAFFNYWLNMRTRDEVLAKNVFSTFRRYYGSCGETVEEVAEDLKRVSSEYFELEENKKPDFETFVHRWKLIGAGVLTPVLLWLFSEKGVPDEQILKATRALESFIVRRMICRMTTMGQNRLFIDLLPRLGVADAVHAGDVVVNYLAEQESNTGIWPDDDQLLNAFINQKLYGLLAQMRIRMVLEGIEAELRSNKAEHRAVTPNLTIEHVMPQGWSEHWDLPSGIDETQARIDRNRLIHTMGNLTLANRRLNTSLYNRPWEEKREELNDHSVLFLNKNLLDNAPGVWDEKAIEARAHALAEVAIKVWPHADGI